MKTKGSLGSQAQPRGPQRQSWNHKHLRYITRIRSTQGYSSNKAFTRHTGPGALGDTGPGALRDTRPKALRDAFSTRKPQTYRHTRRPCRDRTNVLLETLSGLGRSPWYSWSQTAPWITVKARPSPELPLEPGGPLRQDQNLDCCSLQQDAHSHQRSFGMIVTESQEEDQLRATAQPLKTGAIIEVLTCTLGSGGEGRPWWSRASLPWSCEQHSDLILHIRVQMPQLIIGRVHYVGLGPGARGGAIFHLLEDDRAIADDRIGIWLDPQVGGPYGQQLRGGDGCGRFWKTSNQQRMSDQSGLRGRIQA